MRPEEDGALSEFMRWLTVTHTQRWHAHHHSAGTGPLYQGRYKSFPVEDDTYGFTLLRYIERNPLRAGMVAKAEDWRWSSMWRWMGKECNAELRLSPWPWVNETMRRDGRPRDWLRTVNQPLTKEVHEAMERCLQRGQPLGEPGWVERTAARLSLQSTLRPHGRPRKEEKE